MADEKKLPADEDKSINELLKEYAEDVKDKDLDDFLKDTGDDAFEGDDDDTAEDDKTMAAVQPKKSGGLLTMLFIVVAFGAAGAGAYVYLNRDDGMTSIMGGFSGTQTDEPDISPDISMAPPPVPANDNPMLEDGMSMPGTPDQPLPIANQTAETAADPLATPGADLLAVPTGSPDALPVPAADPAVTMPTPSMPAAPAPAIAATPATVPAADVSQAVDAWASGNALPSPELAPVQDMAAPSLPEKQVEEVKARPVKAPKQNNDSAPLMASAPKKATMREASPDDAALPPPYVAIQARKSGGTGADPLPVPQPASAAPKMQPVIEAGARANRDLEGNTNANISDATSATGDTARMIAQGGGVIELQGTTMAAPQAAMPAPQPMPEPVRADIPMRTVPLAIQGGRSVPDNGTAVQTRTYAQIPDAMQAEKPVSADSVAPMTQPALVQVQAPEVVSPRPQAAPSNNPNDARAVLDRAIRAEQAGDADTALTLYQRALEVDAVYGDGQSIDRGMVYDRIGALRAGQ